MSYVSWTDPKAGDATLRVALHIQRASASFAGQDQP